MKNIFSDYTQRIKNVFDADVDISKNDGLGRVTNERAKSFSEYVIDVNKDGPLASLSEFAQQQDRPFRPNGSFGAHPDFGHLRGTNHSEKHWIVSLFIDIVGSTNLYKKYTPEAIHVATNIIQAATIQASNTFGGYVTRLQGDGSLHYFGRKGETPSTAVRSALEFASIFTNWVNIDLKEVIKELEIDKLKTRIGIDLGYDATTIWYSAGAGNASEVTTSSLHTNLASKMQSNASSNGVVAGAHIKNELIGLAELFSPVSSRTNIESDRYIFRSPSVNYGQFDFDYLRFLSKQDYIATSLNGVITYKQPNVTVYNRKPELIVPYVKTNKPYLSK